MAGPLWGQPRPSGCTVPLTSPTQEDPASSVTTVMSSDSPLSCVEGMPRPEVLSPLQGLCSWESSALLLGMISAPSISLTFISHTIICKYFCRRCSQTRKS